ncbi:unnamed protein product, partial [Scytosiphon promiscuus]
LDGAEASGVEGQRVAEEVEHERADEEEKALHGAETAGFSIAGGCKVEMPPAARAGAQDSDVVYGSRVDRRDFGAQCGDGGDPAEDKLSLILSKLEVLQSFVVRGFETQEQEQEKLTAGQRRLEEELGRLRDSLPKLSNASSRCRTNLGGGGRNDRGLSGPVERAPRLSAGTGERELAIVQAGVADPSAPIHDGAVSAQGGGISPDSHTSSSLVLPAASGKQQQQQQPIGSSRQQSGGSAKQVPDIAAFLKEAAVGLGQGEPELPRVGPIESAWGSSVTQPGGVEESKGNAPGEGATAMSTT